MSSEVQTPATEAGAPPDLVALRSHAGIAVVAATVLSSMVGFLDANVVTVAVPAIRRSFNARVETVQWSLTGYLVTAAALLLLSGSLADRFGRRRVLVTGLLVMMVSAVFCSAAPSIGWLIVARAVQGVGASLVVPSSLALLNGTLRVTDRARGIGVWAGLATLGTTLGPYAGGWLVDHASWRWVFLLNIPLIAAGLAALRAVPERITRSSDPLSLDVGGALFAVLGLGGLIYALSAGPSGWTRARVVVAAVIGLGSLLAFIPYERRRRSPMLRLALFRSRQFDAINAMTVLLYGALAAAGYLLVLQCELRLGYSATEAGAALIPESVVFLLLSPLSGALVAKVGPRWLMVSGVLIVAVGFGLLSRAHPGLSYAEAILPGALLWGLGIGLTVTPLTAAVLAAVDDADLGEASAVSDVAARVGGVVAIAVVPLLIGVSGGGGLGAALVHGYRPAMLALAGTCVVAAGVTAWSVANTRTVNAPRLAPLAPHAGCALPTTV
ncbi:MFS transporter [Acidothermaceae bacterium B102]|nr:MFS transporter [Acidothermaceae bacterium B102]